MNIIHHTGSLEYQAKKLLDSLQDIEGNIREMQKEELPNIAMADAFMSIFGYKRVKPTDKELKLKYKKRKEVLEDVYSNKQSNR